MNEWGVVEVLIAIIGLFATIGVPIIKFNASVVELNSTVKELKEDMANLTTRNTESHRRLWTHNEEQDRILNDHDGRIKKLEGRVDAYHGD